MENKALYVIGTGTDTGKTYVSALIIKKLLSLGEDAAYYKAAMSGDERDENGRPVASDAEFVKKQTGISQSVESMCPFVYAHAYSPHLAARTENREVDLDTVMRGFASVSKAHSYTVVEGSGGIVCPLRFGKSGKLYLADVIKETNIPCVLVADAGLGAINSVVLTAEYAATRKIEIRGVIFNNYRDDAVCEDNVFMCEELTGIKAVAKVRPCDGEISADLRELFAKTNYGREK